MQMPQRNQTTSADARYKYSGKELDAETNLYYFGKRYYNSWSGQWLQVDPMADIYPSSTPYNYAGNNPIGGIDPNGMDWYSQTDSNGVVTYNWNSNLNADNASDILGKGQKYVGADAFAYTTEGYQYLGAGGNRYAAWKDGLGFSYYQDNFGMVNQFFTGEMALDNLKAAFMTAAGEALGKALSLFKFGSSAEGVTLPKIGVEYFDNVSDLSKVTGDQLVSYARQIEEFFKEGKIGAFTRDQAALLLKQARRLGVEVRVDEGHPGTFWDMKHINIGPSGYHVPILPK